MGMLLHRRVRENEKPKEKKEVVKVNEPERKAEKPVKSVRNK